MYLYFILSTSHIKFIEHLHQHIVHIRLEVWRSYRYSEGSRSRKVDNEVAYFCVMNFRMSAKERGVSVHPSDPTTPLGVDLWCQNILNMIRFENQVVSLTFQHCLGTNESVEQNITNIVRKYKKNFA